MKKTILLFLLLPMLASAQYFDVFDIDTSEYPIMKAKFYSIDANGKQILNHNPADFEITENDEPRDVISVSCPASLPIPISVGIMVDTKKYINLARHGSERLVNLLNMPQNELAVTYMNQRALLYQDFTNKKQKAVESSKTIPPAPGGTKVSDMFFDGYAGGINMIKTREAQNRVLIYISDLHCPNLSLDEQKLFQEAKVNNIRIYTVLIGTTDYTGLFGRIAEESNGVLFENVQDSTEIENIFEGIIYEEQNDPCEISWKSNSKCLSNINTNLLNKKLLLLSNFKLRITYDQFIRLETNSYLINLGVLKKDEIKDTIVTLVARNEDIIIEKIFSNPDLGNINVLTSLPLTIKKGQSYDLLLRVIAIDTLKNYMNVVIKTEFCETSFGILYGSINNTVGNTTLELTHPNGGEIFTAGSDTLITWKGISDQEEVTLKFSSNNGKLWSLISSSTNSLRTSWIVPRIKSDSCLISIDQYVEESSNKEIGEIEWEKSFGGSSNDAATSIVQTFDGGYIVAGSSQSLDGDITISKGNNDYWVVKLGENGDLDWQKSYGGNLSDQILSLVQTSDGGYIVAGVSQSTDGDIINPKGPSFYWILKLRENGDLDWQKSYGGNNFDVATSIAQTFDEGYIVAGYAKSTDGDITNPKGNNDYWILKLRENGDLDWQKSYGGSGDDYAESIIQTFDGGYIIAGSSSSKNGDITNSKGASFYWILKLKENGNFDWEKSFGGSGNDYAESVIQTFDGGYIVAGYGQSSDGDITNPKWSHDYWIVKLKPNGEIEWEKSFGDILIDDASSIVQTLDGGYIIAGNSESIDGDITNPKGKRDYWILKLKENGNLDWQKSYGGSDHDYAESIIQTINGGYIVAGHSQSKDGDVTEPKGSRDFWIVKISGSSPPLQSDTSDAVFSIIMPEPVIQNSDIDMGQMIVGSTKDTIVSSVICNVGDAPLHVLGVDITDAFDSEDFLIPRGAGDFYLEKDSCQDMMFEFTPSALGSRTAVATIRTTIGDFTDTIHIRGVGINPVIEATADVVDFGKIKLGFSKDTTVFIIENKSNQDINITNTSITGPDLEQFEILSTDKAFTVPANEEKALELRFVAQYTGRVSSFIEFEYDGAIVPLRSMLFAEGINDVVQTITDTIDFGNVRLGNLKDTNVYLIKNKSSLNIDISDMQVIGPDVTQFSIQESGTDFSIGAFDSLRVNLRFAATNPGNTSTIVESYNYLTSAKLETVLLGNGVGGAIQPKMADTYVGEDSDLELHLDGINPSLLSNIATNYSAIISYNSTLLAPIDKSMNVSTENGLSFISITGQLSGVPQIAAVPMKVGLGTADRSGLVVTEFQLYDANGDSVDYDIEPGVGEFNVLGICEEGGKRLLNPDGEATFLKLLPNRTSGQTTVEMTLIESGQTELTIFDQIGNKIETVYSGNPEIGTQEIALDLSQYANGRYYIKLTTPTITKTEILEVVK